MTKDLKWKAVLICSVIVLALVYILPTFSNIPIWWKDNLPSEKISLGLDLQGGVHLLLEVEAEKAIENTLERYAEDLEEILFEERIPFDHVDKISATEIARQQ